MPRDVIKDFIDIYEFAWSDLYREESVRHITISERPSDLERLASVALTENILSYALFIGLGETHPTPVMRLETQTDLFSSVYSAFGGYYRQAIQSLRTWIELTVAGVYFGRTNYSKERSEYMLWVDGKKNTPRWHPMLDNIYGKGEWHNEGSPAHDLDDLREDLSSYVHLRAPRKHDTQAGRDNVPRYLPVVFDRWMGLVLRAARLAFLLLLNEYEDALGKYFERLPDQRQRLEESMNEAYAADFELLLVRTRSGP